MKRNSNRSMMRALRMSLSFLLLVFLVNAVDQVNGLGRLVKKEGRRQIVSTNCGEISAVEIDFDDDADPGKQIYHLQFIRLDPDSIFLPALLHADMVIYVHAGSGTLSYTNGDDMEATRVSKGDVYRLESGSVFYIQSSQETQTDTLRLFAIFSDAGEERKETWVGPYSGIRDLFQGFDTRLLQAAFQAPKEVMEEITKAAEMPPIVHAHHAESGQKKKGLWDKETVFLRAFLEINGIDKGMMERNKKKDKHKHHKHKEETAFNLFKAKRDVDNCDGWSTIVTPKDLHDLKEGLSIAAFMVNLKTGAMAGPHWNPSATEIAVVVEGRGMVRAVCSSNSECNSTRFLVEKCDVFAIPRSHPMAHMSFNNESLVFVGFSVPTGARSSRPQFLAGKDSFLQVLDKRILELAFNVNNTTISRLMASSRTESIQQCVSCAEEEEEKMIDEEEMGKGKERKRSREEEEEEMGKGKERKRSPEEEEEEEMSREEERKRSPEEEEEEEMSREEERKSQEEEEREMRREEERKRSQEEEEEEMSREEERKKRKEEEEEEEELRREEEEEGEWEREERWESPSRRGRKESEGYRKRRE